jgi:hypothetical protein
MLKVEPGFEIPGLHALWLSLQTSIVRYRNERQQLTTFDSRNAGYVLTRKLPVTLIIRQTGVIHVNALWSVTERSVTTSSIIIKHS